MKCSFCVLHKMLVSPLFGYRRCRRRWQLLRSSSLLPPCSSLRWSSSRAWLAHVSCLQLWRRWMNLAGARSLCKSTCSPLGKGESLAEHTGSASTLYMYALTDSDVTHLFLYRMLVPMSSSERLSADSSLVVGDVLLVPACKAAVDSVSTAAHTPGILVRPLHTRCLPAGARRPHAASSSGH